MAKPLIIILLIFLGFGIGYYLYNKPEVSEYDTREIEAHKEPYQAPLINLEVIVINKKDLELKLFPQAKYVISARILHRKRYSDGWGSKISPIDLVLGWGDISKPEMFKEFKFRQISRWYTFRYKSQNLQPLSMDYVASHSSNHHIIPATENITKALIFAKKSDLIELDGYLVNVIGKYKGSKAAWYSSLSRLDTGNRSCEVMYVKKLKIGTKVYK